MEPYHFVIHCQHKYISSVISALVFFLLLKTALVVLIALFDFIFL